MPKGREEEGSPLKVLVVGGGGREHAIAWKLAQSPHVTEVICQSGNPGMAQVATCASEPEGGVEAMADWAIEQRIELTVVGPEAYLELGIVDALLAADSKWSVPFEMPRRSRVTRHSPRS